jgi:DNA (cytosine-5)-methyltransferase 1
LPNVIDLYAGAGGLSLGAARAGFNVAAAVEFNPHAMNTHMLNFPRSIHILRDISDLNGEALLQLSGLNQQDLIGIIGGPPCQGFSSIGHGAVDDPRNTLFTKFFQLVEELQPVFFVAENVPGIMNNKFAQIRTMAFAHVQNYQLLPPIRVDASEYGAPTTRTRYFFIGYRVCNQVEPFTLEAIEQMKVPLQQRTTVRQALEGLPNKVPYVENSKGFVKLSRNYYNIDAAHKQSAFFYVRTTDLKPDNIGDPEYVRDYANRHRVNGLLPTKHSDDVRLRYSLLRCGERDSVSKSIRLNPKRYSPTLRAGTGPEKGSYQAVRPIHFKDSRVITPREAARLQGFPDWFKLPDTIWHGFRQIGNSVSPIVAERILTAIYQRLI